VFGLPLLGEFGWSEHAQGGVGTVGVVLLTPVSDKGFEQGAGLLDREQFVPHAAAVGLHPGRAGLDVAGAGPGEPAPVPQRVGGQLGPVVAADELREAAAGGDLVQHGDGGVGVDRVGGQVGERLAGELGRVL